MTPPPGLLPAVDRRPHGARPPRLRFALTTLTQLLLATAVCVLSVLIASRASVRLDLTATRAHSLSPRTLSLIDSLDEDIEILILADPRKDARDAGVVDAAAWERVTDVLYALSRSSARVRATSVDLSNPTGAALQFSALSRITALDPAALRRVAETVTAATVTAASIADSLTATGIAFDRAASAIAPTTEGRARELAALSEQASLLRSTAASLMASATAADDHQRRPISNAPVPAFDSATSALTESLGPLVGQLSTLADITEQYAALVDASARPALLAISRSLIDARDKASRADDSLRSLPPLAALAAARKLERGGAALVIGQSGARSIDLASLFPSAAQLSQAGAGAADVRFLGEQRLCAAIASLTHPKRPIYVFVHDQSFPLLRPAGGAPSGYGAEQLAGRLRLRGDAPLEWSVLESSEPPPLHTLNPRGDRPVVWVVTASAATTPDTVRSGAKLAIATRRLLAAGERVLLSLAPSMLPSAGEPDPFADLVAPFGLSADTGKVLVSRRSTPDGPRVLPDLTLRRALDGHPIGETIQGAPFRAVFAPAMRLATAPPPDSTAAALLLQPTADDIWAEAEWLQLGTGASAGRFDDANGPWVIAAAAERPHPAGLSVAQRVVVVAATGWLLDGLQQWSSVDGRSYPTHPGNTELFDAAGAWLTGQDSLLARGAQSVHTPRIASLSPQQTLGLRWFVIAGIPLGPLVLGGVLWFLRR